MSFSRILIALTAFLPIFIMAQKPAGTDLIITRASVISDNIVEIEFQAGENFSMSEFHILRSVNQSGPYVKTGNLSGSGALVYNYIDKDAEPSRSSYYYKIQSSPSAGEITYVSDFARTIYAAARGTNAFNYEITWNDYEGASATPDSRYWLYRVIDGRREHSPLAILPYGTLNFRDNTEITGITGSIGYLLMMVNKDANTGIEDIIWSNLASAGQNSGVFLPNAFSPKGRNESFKPFSAIISQAGYQFTVYNRWGQAIFSTNNPAEGWDGTFKGEYVPPGVYVYYLRFVMAGGEEFERNGSVTVVY